MLAVFFKTEKSDEPVLPSTSLHSDNSTVANEDQLSQTEKDALINYVDRVCNRNLNNRLSEFDDINGADKAWIYSHITREDHVYSLTEDEIIKDLHNLFGDDLIINPRKDTVSGDKASMPQYSEENSNFELPIFGMDNSVEYAVNTVKKTDGQYIVNVVEYNSRSDMDTSEIIISAYDDNSNEQWKWKEVFRSKSPSDEDDILKIKEELKQTVLERKNDFKSFDITIEHNGEGRFIVKRIAEVV